MVKLAADKPNRSKAFTLIELLLVMLISSIIIVGINSSYRQAYLIWSNIEGNRPIYHNARQIMDTFRQELSGLYFPPADTVENGPEKENDNMPFMLSVLPDGTTELAFYTLTPSWKKSPISSRIARISYHFTKDIDNGKTILRRFEQSYAAEKPIGIQNSDVIAEGLSEFKIWVANADSDISGNTWSDFFNSKNIPPKAVRISFEWPTGKDNRKVKFMTSIPVYCQDPLLP